VIYYIIHPLYVKFASVGFSIKNVLHDNANGIDFRVFWRRVGQKLSEKQDTHLTFVKLSNLKPGVHYETVVKAGNSHGTSILTEPVPFITEDNLISSASTGKICMSPECGFFLVCR
jgi:hypothetical protein